MIRPGKRLVIVENEQSKRSTPAAISFTDQGREYGYNALKELVKKPESTLLFLHNIFSIQINNQEYFKRLYQPIKLKENTERNSTLIKIGTKTYETEEIMAMLFEHVHDMSEKFGEGIVKDCAVTIPIFWTRAQKIGLINSAQAAGLNILALMHENTGAALYYGIDRLDNITDHLALFYNLGSSYLQVTLAKYSFANKKISKTKQIENVEILAHSWDSTLGGSLFDSILAEYLAEKFKKVHGITITDIPKAMTRLLQQSNLAKKTLSANKSTFVIVNSIHKGIDFSYSLTRDEFEELIKPFAERLVLPIFEVINKAGITVKDINTLEIIGGVSRIPKVQEIIKEKTGLDASTHLNGDESMAQGAAIYAANFSSVIQVKPMWLTDISIRTYSARFFSDSDLEWSKETILFKDGSKLGNKKKITFAYNKNVKIVVEEIQGEKRIPLLLYEINGVEDIEKSEISLFFSFILDYSGIPFLNSADAKYEVEVKKKTRKNKKIVEKNEENDDDSGEGLKKQGYSKRKSENKADSSEKSEATVDSSEKFKEKSNPKKEIEKDIEDSQEKESNDTNTKEETANNETSTSKNSSEEIIKTETKTVHLKLLETDLEQPTTLSQQQVEDLVEKLKTRKNSEIQAKKLTEAKNELESFLYSTADRVHEPSYTKVLSEDERVDIVSEIFVLRAWVESNEFDNATIGEVKARGSRLQQKVNPGFLREKEAEIRDEIVQKAMEDLVNLEEALTKLNQTKPWIPAGDMLSAKIKLNDTIKWIKRKVKEQKALKDWEPLAFTSTEVEKKVADMQKQVEKLKKTTKPKAKVRNK